MNLIAGEVENSGGTLRFRGPGFKAPIPSDLSGAASAATLGVRPEHLSLSGDGGIFQGEVQLVEPLGKDTLLYFDHGGEKPLIAVVEGTKHYSEGDRLGFSIDTGRLYLFGADGKRIR